jgi:hypothetical protein
MDVFSMELKIWLSFVKTSKNFFLGILSNRLWSQDDICLCQEMQNTVDNKIPDYICQLLSVCNLVQFSLVCMWNVGWDV